MLSNEGLGVLEELDGILDARAEQSVELVAAPLNAVLNLVGEVTERAHGDGLFGRILRVTVGLGLVRNDHLRVGLGAESAGLEERLAVPDALTIDVETSLNVIDGVDDEVETFPEVIVEDVLSLWSNESLMGDDLEIRVHDFSLAARCLRLGMADIGLAEEELTVQVGDLNVIVVSDGDGASGAATETHEGHGFSVLAAERTSTDHESLDGTKLLLHLTAVDPDLVVVAAVHWLAVNVALGKRLEAVVMGPLPKGHVLASKLDDFLSNEATEHGAHGSDRASAVRSNLPDDILVNFLDRHGACSF